MKGFWLVLGLMASMPAHSQTTRVDVYTHNNGPIDYSVPSQDPLNSISQGLAIGQQLRQQRERAALQRRQVEIQSQAAAAAAIANEKARKAASERTQVLISTIPELAAWQASDSTRWNMAVVIDQDLSQSAQYQAMPARERLLKVVEIVKSVPVATPEPVAAAPQ